MDWQRLVTRMILECLKAPGEFLTFGQLAFRMKDVDKGVLQSIADNYPNLFLVADGGRSTKLHTETVRQIVTEGMDSLNLEPEPLSVAGRTAGDPTQCGHFSKQELMADLQRSSLPAEALTRTCCWREICRLRAAAQPPITERGWHDICVTRGYLLARQNPRGF